MGFCQFPYILLEHLSAPSCFQMITQWPACQELCWWWRRAVWQTHWHQQVTGYYGYRKGHNCKACGSSVNAPSRELHGGVIESCTNIILEHCRCSKPPSGEFWCRADVVGCYRCPLLTGSSWQQQRWGWGWVKSVSCSSVQAVLTVFVLFITLVETLSPH